VKFVNVLVTYMELEADTDPSGRPQGFDEDRCALQHGFCGLALDSAVDAAFGLFLFESGSNPADLFVRPHGEGSILELSLSIIYVKMAV